MISLYNRINSAANALNRRTRIRQTSWAWYKTWDHISIFSIPFTKRAPAQNPMGARWCPATPEGENFRVPLFLRTFLQVCHFHFGIAPGSFSFACGKKLFSRKLASLNQRRKMALDQHPNPVSYNVLKSDLLRCDSLSFLPESSSLMPSSNCWFSTRIYERRSTPHCGLLILHWWLQT